VQNLFCGNFSFQIYFAVTFRSKFILPRLLDCKIYFAAAIGVQNLFCGSIFLYITVRHEIGKRYKMAQQPPPSCLATAFSIRETELIFLMPSGDKN